MEDFATQPRTFPIDLPMHEWLPRHYPVHVEVRPGRGRCLVATQPLEPGTIVMASTLAAQYPSQPEVRCNFCYAPPGGSSQTPSSSSTSSSTLMRCAACRSAHYCTQACQKADWSNHKHECKQQLSWLRALPYADRATLLLLGRLHRGLGLRRRSSLTTSISDPRSSHKTAASSDNTAPTTTTTTTTSSSSSRNIELERLDASHIYMHTPADVVGMMEDSSKILDAHFTQLLHQARAKGFLPPLSSSNDTTTTTSSNNNAQDDAITSSADDVGVSLDTDEKALHLLKTFDCNNFGIVDELLSLRGSGVSPMGAILNHSCRPNCVIGYSFQQELELELSLRNITKSSSVSSKGIDAVGAGQQADSSNNTNNTSSATTATTTSSTGSSPTTKDSTSSISTESLVAKINALEKELSPPAKARHILVVRVLTPVAAGDELTHAYVEQALLAEHRQEYLSRTYGFQCGCGACEDAASSSSPGLLDPARFTLAPAAYTVASGTTSMSSSSSSSSPSSSSIRVGVVRAIPTAEGRTKDAEDDIISDFTGLSTDAISEVKSAQGLLAAAHIALSKPEIFDSLPDLRSSIAPRTEDADLIRRAARTRGFPVQDVRDLLKEIRTLETALGLFRKHLHPLHTQVMQTVTMLHERYMAVGDDRSAAAANEHIIAHHRHVYTVLNGVPMTTKIDAGNQAAQEQANIRAGHQDVSSSLSSASPPCPVHPMLSLQFFTGGDLYAGLAESIAAEDVQPCIPRRVKELTTLFVEYDNSDRDKKTNDNDSSSNLSKTSTDFTGARIRPVTSPIVSVAGKDATKLAMALWLAQAIECYHLAAEGLSVTHGSCHPLVAEAYTRLERTKSLMMT